MKLESRVFGLKIEYVDNDPVVVRSVFDVDIREVDSPIVIDLVLGIALEDWVIREEGFVKEIKANKKSQLFGYLFNGVKVFVDLFKSRFLKLFGDREYVVN